MCVLPAACIISSTNYFADPTTQLCKAACPSGYFADVTTWTCVQTCPLGYFADNNNAANPYCYTTCTVVVSTGWYADAQNNLCVQVCPSSPISAFGRTTDYTCVRPFECPTTTPSLQFA
jgi:hypothetical protein